MLISLVCVLNTVQASINDPGYVLLLFVNVIHFLCFCLFVVLGPELVSYIIAL